MERWLTCTVSRGMFSEEVAVVVTTREGQVSFFLPRDSVDAPEHPAGAVQGRIRVVLLREEGTDGVVSLPAQPFEGSQVARVPREALTAA